MTNYNVTFKTNELQETPYTKSVQASCAKDARKEMMADAQIPARFILSVKKIKD